MSHMDDIAPTTANSKNIGTRALYFEVPDKLKIASVHCVHPLR